MRDSVGSRRDQNVVVGDGGRMPNKCQVSLSLEAFHSGGATEQLASRFEVADLTRPLMSVSQICEQGCQCIFTDTHATVVNREGTLGRFEKQGQLCVARMKLKAPERFGRPR